MMAGRSLHHLPNFIVMTRQKVSPKHLNKRKRLRNQKSSFMPWIELAPHTHDMEILMKLPLPAPKSATPHR